MTKEEIKEVMEEMECWSCDNHLNICDKHSRREKEVIQTTEGAVTLAKGITVKDNTTSTSKEWCCCNKEKDIVCNLHYTPRYKEMMPKSTLKCESCKIVGCKTCSGKENCNHSQDTPKECKHTYDGPLNQCTKCLAPQPGNYTPTPPSKVDPCKNCGAKKPKFCTCKHWEGCLQDQGEDCSCNYPKPTRLEEIRETLKTSYESAGLITYKQDVETILTKLDTAMEALESAISIPKKDKMHDNLGDVAVSRGDLLLEIQRMADQALKSINEDE